MCRRRWSRFGACVSPPRSTSRGGDAFSPFPFGVDAPPNPNLSAAWISTWVKVGEKDEVVQNLIVVDHIRGRDLEGKKPRKSGAGNWGL